MGVLSFEGIRKRFGAGLLPPALEALCVAILPVVLLLDLRARFYWDWPNHIWLMDYYGAYLAEHGRFPLMLNTHEYVGIPYPVFYGFGFYPLMGLLSTWLCAETSFRLFAYLLYVVQHYLFLRLALRLGVARVTASVMAGLLTLAIYPLTNLYNRSALTEFVATLWLSIGILCLLSCLTHTDRRRAIAYGLCFTLAITMAAVTHPITALYGGLFVAVALPVLLLALPGRRTVAFRTLGLVLGGGALGLAIAAPWVLATMATLGDLEIPTSLGGVLFYDFDTLACRLTPIPFDPRTWGADLDAVSTPHLEAPTNICMLALWVALYFTVRRRVPATTARRLRLWFWLFLLAWAALVFASVEPSVLNAAPVLLQTIQFGYRLATYQNLVLLVGLLVSLLILRETFREPIRVPTTVLVVVALLGAAGYIQKVAHGRAIATQATKSPLVRTDDERKRILHLPDTFYGVGAYGTPSQYTRLKGAADAPYSVVFDPGASGFGRWGELEVEAPLSQWYRTNVQAFYWNHVIVDGAAVPAERVASYRRKQILPFGTMWHEGIAIHLDSGVHQVRLETVYPAGYLTLVWVSIFAACVLVGLTFTVVVVCLVTRRGVS